MLMTEPSAHDPEDETVSEPTVPDSDDVFAIPASSAQERLWFFDQMQPESPVYTIPAAFRLRGRLDVPALEQSLNEIVRRHESLRTSFAGVEGEPVQIITPEVRLRLSVTDLTRFAPEAREAEVARLVEHEVRRPFVLSEGPLLRTSLLRLGADEHVLTVTMHHIIADAWSLDIFSRELAVLYAAHRAGERAALPELTIQYADFALWERDVLAGDALDEQLAYWREKLSGQLPVLQLPGDRPRPAAQTYRGSWRELELGEELTTRLKALSRRERVTLFTTMLAAFKVLLYRYSGQEDLVVGAPLANRDRPEMEGLIGFFVNTVVFRSTVPADASFRDYLAQLREVVQETLAHQNVPFERVVEAVRPGRDLSYSPVFQTLFTLQQAPMRLALDGLEIEPVQFDNGTAKFDLFFELWEEAGGIRGRIEYSTDLFDAPTIDRLIEHYGQLLQGIVIDPGRALEALPLLTEPESRQILVSWNDTVEDLATVRCAHELFEEQAARTPDAPAVVFGGEALTYAEIDGRSNQVARYLARRGVGPDVLVGICVERSVEMLVAVLGVLKAGGAYVPLDVVYPRERLAFMLADSAAPVLLTQSGLRDRLPESGAEVVCLDDDWEAIARESAEKVDGRATLDNLAYVIYTSGSTGMPKGVAMPHRPLANLVGWQIQSSGGARAPRTAQFASLSFDVSFQEIFSTWCVGGTLVVVSEEQRRDAFLLVELLARESVGRLFVPFVALQQMAEAVDRGSVVPSGLREIITAGEQLEITPQIVSLIDKLDGCSLHNQYGPSESHVVTAHMLRGSPTTWPTLPPIGRPIANVRIYLLDKLMHPVPVGVAGELYIGGVCLARHYLNRPDLTDERFVSDPFGTEPGERLYRTGDLARYLADGSIEFLGRADHQLKIRGFRVEPGEVESVLRQYPGVADAVVVAREDSVGTGRLVAYLVPVATGSEASDELPVGALRNFLTSKLPEYMVPTGFAVLTALPLTPSGKVDRRALPALEQRVSEGAEGHLAPRSPVERRLAEIWEEVLGTSPIGVLDNFFEIGGHSLLAVRLMNRIEQAYGKRLPLTLLYTGATVEHLATHLMEPEAAPPRSALVEIQPNGTKPPFFCVSSPHVNALGYYFLARHLGPDQPVYGLQAQREKQDEGEFTPRELLVLAGDCVEAMRSVQPQGPYMFGGLCGGAAIAFEMARQLEAQGQEVGLLVIFDTWVLENAYSWVRFHMGYYASRLRTAWEQPWAERRVMLRQAIARRVRKVRAVMTGESGDGSGERNPWLEAYFPGPGFVAPTVSGRITVFRVHKQPFVYIRDAQLGWGARALGGVEVHEVPGEHETIFREPHVQVLAEELGACLSRTVGDQLERVREQSGAVGTGRLA
jgi:amino acid adenylation domain-containing protein